MTEETVGTPVFVSLREAARRTGLSKATIARKIKSGEISVRERGDDGSLRIDPSELLRFMDASRVQRATASAETVGTAPQTPETPPSLALLEERHARELAEAQLANLKALVEHLTADRDRWHTQATQAQEQAAAVTRLLPGPRPERRVWWRRFRRAG